MVFHIKRMFYFYFIAFLGFFYLNTVVAKDFWLPDEVGDDNLNHPGQLIKNLPDNLLMDINFTFKDLPSSGALS